MYDYLILAFSPLVKGDDGFTNQYPELKQHFCDGGVLDFTKEDAQGRPIVVNTLKFFRRVNTSLMVQWDQKYPKSHKMRGKKLPFTYEYFKSYLLSKFGPLTAARLTDKPVEMLYRSGGPMLDAYIMMVIMGDCRAKVLSREVGEYSGGYIPFSMRRRNRGERYLPYWRGGKGWYGLSS